jgi:hypothetical protein
MGPVTRVDAEAVHELVRDAARRGVPAVFDGDHVPNDRGDGNGNGGIGALADGHTDTGTERDRDDETGDELPRYDDTDAWAGRSIDGAWLARFLTDDAGEIHGRGLTIVGARIVGGLDLDGATLPRRFALIACQLGPHRIVLRDAHTRTVQLDTVACGGIAAERVHVDGSLLLDGSRVDGTVRLVDARVEASVVAKGARIEAPAPPPSPLGAKARVALDADRARVAGSFILSDRFTATGSVRLFGSSIGGDLFLVGAHVHNPGGGTVRASGAEVAGSVILDKAVVEGEVQMFGIKVGRDISCKRVRFDNAGGDALSIDGADVNGGVMLQRSTTRGRVRLVNSSIRGDLRCGSARIEGSSEGALVASRATIGGNAFLDLGFVARGKVRLPGASIGRSLRCSSATMSTPNGVAVEADGLRVGAGVQLNDGFKAAGEVRLIGATIGTGLDCSGASLDRGESNGPALDCRNARIDGNVRLEGGFEAQGTVRFVGATIGGELNLRGARVVHPEGPSVHATGAQVGATLFLTDGFHAEGEVRILGVVVGGDLHITDATIVGSPSRRTGHGLRAITLTRARITGDVSLIQGIRTDGLVRLARSTIGGNLRLGRGTFRHPGHDAVDVTHAQVSGSLVLGEDTALEGRLNLASSTVGGSLDVVQGATLYGQPGDRALVAANARIGGSFGFHGKADGDVVLRGISVGSDVDFGGAQLLSSDATDPALKGDRAQITGSLLLNNGFHAEGEVRFRGATINGHVSVARARIANPGGMALNLTASTITAGLVLAEMTAEGETRLQATIVRGNVGCEGARFLNPQGTASLMAAGMQAAGSLFLHDGFHAEGPVVLRGAAVDTLQDDRSSWPESLDLDGFRYLRLVCPPRDRSWRARREWLRRQLTPSAQGYVHLADVYRSSGDETDARRILIERHNALLRPPEHWRDQLPHGPFELMRKAWRWMLRVTIGHGFAPGRALLIALPLVAAMTLWLGYARDHDMLTPSDETAGTLTRDDVPRSSDCEASYPCVQPLMYVADSVIPFLELGGQRSHWTPDQSHRGDTWLDDGRAFSASVWTTRALGAVLAALIAASFTQVVRRE